MEDRSASLLSLVLGILYPDIHDDIDWSRGYEALDKEFQQIIRKAAVGKGFADMLFKVWLKGGEEFWLFIHVDVQAEYDKDFPRRMFDYNTAVHKLYNREVVGDLRRLSRHIHAAKTLDELRQPLH